MSLFHNLRKIHGIKSEIRTLVRAFRDDRTSMITKLSIGLLALAYIISPIDIAPDILPLLGISDDALIIPLLMWILIPNHILDDARRHIAMIDKKESHKHSWIFWLCIIMLSIMLLYTLYQLLK